MQLPAEATPAESSLIGSRLVRSEEHSAHHHRQSAYREVRTQTERSGGRHQPLQHPGESPPQQNQQNQQLLHLLLMFLQAQHNTRMLATYAALDPRVQFLGYTMKVFAKVWPSSCCLALILTHTLILTPVSAQRCDIGDASRGSLSSYAYILMVLYFLQQRQPPVIPVLQEVLSPFVFTPPGVDVDGTFLMVSDLLYSYKALDSVTLSVQTQSDPGREQS